MQAGTHVLTSGTAAHHSLLVAATRSAASGVPVAFAAVDACNFGEAANVGPVGAVIPSVGGLKSIDELTAALETGAVESDAASRFALCLGHVKHGLVCAEAA